MAGDTMRLLVQAVRPEANGIVGLKLASGDGRLLPPFEAGAHVDVHLGEGLCRQYSLIGDVSGSCYEIAVKLEPRSMGGSARMHQLKPGDELVVGQPRNNFPIVRDAASHVLFAGGIGVTPLLSMARTFVRAGTPFHLHYFASSIGDVAFADELMSSPMSAHVTFHVGFAPEQVSLTSSRILAHRPTGSHLYLCGPTPFMDSVRAIALRKWPAASVHLEHFTAVAAAYGGAFEITLARTGRTFEIPENASMLDVLNHNGVDVDYACQKGICGTCIVRLLQGNAEHRDAFLSEAEKSGNQSIALCVSRGRGRLVLDI